MTSTAVPRRDRAARWMLAAGPLAALTIAASGCTDLVQTAATPPVETTSTAQHTFTHATTDTPVTATTQAVSETAERALATLNALPVKGRAPKTGYDRDLFGQRWSDDVDVEGGHNGCDTRNDILRRDLTDITVKPGTRGCVVLSGTLQDPYTGKTIRFVRGQDTSSAVQIDHVVALSDAWQKGAQQLSPQRRADLANDPRNLQAVDGPTNQKKGDGDAATWLPPNKGYRCTYVSRQVEVKASYGLWVTQAEKDAIARVLTSCGATPASSATSTTDRADTRTRTATPAPEPTGTPTYTPPRLYAPTTEAPAPAAPDAGSVYYPNCSAAKDAGAAPLYAGQPGYRAKLDRDGDGVACES
ncbi:GmrSD restriction endonuclease domain-containing protein [Gordonia aurantiaca]|uniref:GmrSD restriction endonuclease domain-containing protein n=1 Tax=Gordonia sp. B21 TaxID=3151852 RepID=UPI003267E580